MEKLSDTAATVASNLRLLRWERGWTLEQACERLEAIGWPMKVAVLSKAEKGDRGVSVGDAAALARIYGIGVNELLLPPDIRAASRLRGLLEELDSSGTELKALQVAAESLARRAQEAGVRNQTAWRAILTQVADDDALAESVRGHLTEQYGADEAGVFASRLDGFRKTGEF